MCWAAAAFKNKHFTIIYYLEADKGELS